MEKFPLRNHLNVINGLREPSERWLFSTFHGCFPYRGDVRGSAIVSLQHQGQCQSARSWCTLMTSRWRPRGGGGWEGEAKSINWEHISQWSTWKGAEMAHRPREEDFSRAADGRSTWKHSTKTCDGVEMHERAHKQQQQHPCRCVDSTPGSLPACARAFPPRRYPVAMRGWLVTAAEAIWHLLRGDAALLQKQHTARGAEAARTASLSLPLRPACSSRLRPTLRPFAATPRRK